ncbi:TolC family protein [Chondromyces apiculatus]|uniref:Outer membrane efflux protein, putative n=1 Tax=Chondromyces apiculatus DSM 436 TaxID=1192034 RepID=A0A017T536_9BACT|nr:TolC family protein [Chondromyces apiculatus]EYF04349.1 outer membrane efflux protein, putative [Chondromyces apiculatus DSM 436]
MGRRIAGIRLLAAAVVAALGLVVPLAGADEGPDEPGPSEDERGPRAELAGSRGAAAISRGAVRTYDLPRCLALADQHHPNVLVSRAKLNQVRAQLDEAHYAPYSQWRLAGGVALAPTVRGNNVFSPNTDVALTSSLGVAWRFGIDGVVPLWTFGKITNLWNAAEANVRVNEASVEKERDVVRLDVRKAYFGLQLARDGRLLLADVRVALKSALAKLQEQVDNEEGDPIDLLKLQTFAAEIDVREAEADKYIAMALAGLRFYTGVADLDIPDAPIAPPKHKLGHVSRYLTAARLHRPELMQARAGIAARTAQVHLARSQLFPDIGLGLQFGMSTAPEVANQINPFVSDPGNYFSYGAAIGLQWRLDFLSQSARIRYAEAQLEEVTAQQRYALGGVASEVEIAYAEVVEAQKRLDAYSKAARYARRWLLMVQQGIDVGTSPDKDLIDPARSYAQNRYNQLNATMELDLAMSRLARATGWDAIAPDGT